MVPHSRILGGSVTCARRAPRVSGWSVRVTRHSRPPVCEAGACRARQGARTRTVRARYNPSLLYTSPASFAWGAGRSGGGKHAGQCGGVGGRGVRTGGIRARHALEGRACAPPPLLGSSCMVPHHSGALAGGRLEHEHAVRRARRLHRRRHVRIARPLLAGEHQGGQDHRPSRLGFSQRSQSEGTGP